MTLWLTACTARHRHDAHALADEIADSLGQTRDVQDQLSLVPLALGSRLRSRACVTGRRHTAGARVLWI